MRLRVASSVEQETPSAGGVPRRLSKGRSALPADFVSRSTRGERWADLQAKVEAYDSFLDGKAEQERKRKRRRKTEHRVSQEKVPVTKRNAIQTPKQEENEKTKRRGQPCKEDSEGFSSDSIERRGQQQIFAPLHHPHHPRLTMPEAFYSCSPFLSLLSPSPARLLLSFFLFTCL